MAIGRADHLRPRWGRQAITSWGRHGTGIGVCVSAGGGGGNERRGYGRGEEGSV